MDENNQVNLPQESGPAGVCIYEDEKAKLVREWHAGVCDYEAERAKHLRERAADELREAFFSIEVKMEGVRNIGDGSRDYEVHPLEISSFLRRVADEVDDKKGEYFDWWRNNSRWGFTKTCLPKGRLEELAGYLDISKGGGE